MPFKIAAMIGFEPLIAGLQECHHIVRANPVRVNLMDVLLALAAFAHERKKYE